MHNTLLKRFFNSYSENRKSKTCTEMSRRIQNLEWGRIFAIAAAFAMFAPAAQAQQPAPVRIGWISTDRGGNSPGCSTPFATACANSATLRDAM